jgi:hypothetical protein
VEGRIKVNNRVYTTKKVPVAGVPVTVIGHELAVQVGRFDPQAAAGRLRVNHLSGTAAVAVHVAGEGGPRGTGERWVAGLYPAAPAETTSSSTAKEHTDGRP